MVWLYNKIWKKSSIIVVKLSKFFRGCLNKKIQFCLFLKELFKIKTLLSTARTLSTTISKPPFCSKSFIFLINTQK